MVKTGTELVAELSSRIDEGEASCARSEQYWRGEQPLAYLSPASREALGNGFRTLRLNYPRLAVESHAERLRVQGFLLDGAESPVAWERFEEAGGEDSQHRLHLTALSYGRAFVTCWATPTGSPSLDVVTPRELVVKRARRGGPVAVALRRWIEDGRAHAVLMSPEAVRRYRSASFVPEGGMVPAHGWEAVQSFPNPLGRVPVVEFANGEEGTSEMEGVIDLSDALSKVSADMLTTSEYFARPRRWATGIEVVEDEHGEPVDPFVEGPSRIIQAENEAARFGEFSSSSLSAYESAVGVLTKQLGALSGLPPHYLASHQDQPASADAIRSAEASLVARVLGKQRAFGPRWGEVASLLEQIETRRVPRRVETIWASPETRTPGQEADAAAKLVQAGILPAEEALLDMGYSPERVRRIRTDRRVESVRRELGEVAS